MTTPGRPPPGSGQPPESGQPGGAAAGRWVLTLYVSGASPHSAAAVEAVRRLCDTELRGMVEVDVVDVHDQPAHVVRDEILATPTLVKRLPLPLRRLVGDLSDTERVRIGLDLRAAGEDEAGAAGRDRGGHDRGGQGTDGQCQGAERDQG